MELEFHYHVHNSLPLVPIPCQMYPLHIFPPHFPKIHCNINSLHLLPGLPSSLFLPGFPTEILYAFLILLTTDQLYFTGEDPS